jgi:predicted nucleic acid-binding protein
VILVDTSVWIDHFRRGSQDLVAALEREEVATHPFVIGEIACGHLKDRAEVLHLLGTLPAAPVATDEEVLVFIEERKLMGRGIGYIDVHLLASAALGDDLRLWTIDTRLSVIARRLKLA